ncbi:MAG: hypothetical protein RR365_04630 [Bacteroides sp.]
MEEEIKRTVRLLKRSYAAFWVLPLGCIMLGETDVAAVGGGADNRSVSYFLESACILLTAVCVPLSLKLFSLVLTKKIDTYTFPVALYRYKQWSLVRLAILELGVLFGLVVYYYTLSSTGVLCAAIGLTASFFSLPGEKKLREELRINED